jgi:lipopolysaccharide export system protein LptA
MKLRRGLACLLLALGPRLSGAVPAAPAPAAAPLPPTTIESGALELFSTEKETTFTYSRGVRITATNLVLTCDHLVVIARRTGDPAALVGRQEKLKSLVASGNVRLVQDDREATADRAEVFPDDDRVILTGNPVVRSVKDGWEQRGPRMELLRGERRAVIRGEGAERPRTVLPPLKDLGYDKVPERRPAPANPPAAPSSPVPAAPAPR